MEKGTTKIKYSFQNREEYIKALDSVMPEKWISKRSLGGGKTHRYLPIAIKDAIADDLFLEWNIIDEQFINLHNELICTVKTLRKIRLLYPAS